MNLHFRQAFFQIFILSFITSYHELGVLKCKKLKKISEMLILASKATNGSASLVNRFFFQPLYQIFKKQATRQLRATQCYDGINFLRKYLTSSAEYYLHLIFSHTNCKWITFFRDWLHSPYSSKCSFIEQWDDIIIHEYVRGFS